MKILLVEDLAVTSKPVKMLLTMEGHHVDVAEDPGEALDICLLYTSPSPRDRG